MTRTALAGLVALTALLVVTLLDLAPPRTQPRRRPRRGLQRRQGA